VVTGDQFVVTHCTTADSVLGAPGYGVRAASTTDPEELRRAIEYPPYELPIDMWAERPDPAQTPQRLARTDHPGGGVWVAHSAYLATDTMGRDRSYLTHLLHLPAADPASVLESWATGGWMTEYPPGAPKTLAEGTLPVGDLISPGALTAFLSRPQDGPADLSVVVCPPRLRSKHGRHARRELVGRFLKAFLLTRAARQSGGRRDRLFVHAEPGLVAMLLYAAVRILPPAWTADLTFSTFEPHHKGLRDYRLATVVGTVTGSAAEGLDPDLATARGYGLDTLHPELSSPELAGPIKLPRGVEQLLELAAAGRWEVLAEVHRQIGTGEGALARVGEAITRLQTPPSTTAPAPDSPAPKPAAPVRFPKPPIPRLGPLTPPAPAAPAPPPSPEPPAPAPAAGGRRERRGRGLRRDLGGRRVRLRRSQLVPPRRGPGAGVRPRRVQHRAGVADPRRGEAGSRPHTRHATPGQSPLGAGTARRSKSTPICRSRSRARATSSGV
jgi:hypothetical protein